MKQATLQEELLQLTRCLLETRVECGPLLIYVHKDATCVQHSSEEHNESSGSESGGSNITQ